MIRHVSNKSVCVFGVCCLFSSLIFRNCLCWLHDIQNCLYPLLMHTLWPRCFWRFSFFVVIVVVFCSCTPETFDVRVSLVCLVKCDACDKYSSQLQRFIVTCTIVMSKCFLRASFFLLHQFFSSDKRKVSIRKRKAQNLQTNVFDLFDKNAHFGGF